jgi:hypothetical protein
MPPLGHLGGLAYLGWNRPSPIDEAGGVCCRRVAAHAIANITDDIAILVVYEFTQIPCIVVMVVT